MIVGGNFFYFNSTSCFWTMKQSCVFIVFLFFILFVRKIYFNVGTFLVCILTKVFVSRTFLNIITVLWSFLPCRQKKTGKKWPNSKQVTNFLLTLFFLFFRFFFLLNFAFFTYPIYSFSLILKISRQKVTLKMKI